MTRGTGDGAAQAHNAGSTNAARATLPTAGTGPPPPRRADAGAVRLGERDVAGLLLCGDMYAAPYDLLAGFLRAPPRLQQQLYQAFDLQARYKKNMHQVTIHVTITDSTPAPSPPSSTTPTTTRGTPPRTRADMPIFRI